MIITQISACKKSKDRCNIYVDGGFYCALFFDIAMEYGLKKGIEISREELDNIIREDRFKKCFFKGCALLSVRTRGEKELRLKLRDKEFSQEEIDRAITMLKSRG